MIYMLVTVFTWKPASYRVGDRLSLSSTVMKSSPELSSPAMTFRLPLTTRISSGSLKSESLRALKYPGPILRNIRSFLSVCKLFPEVAATC